MRWERLFDDLEASAEAEDRAAFEAEVADLARAERSRLSLADRLTAHVGRRLVVHLVDGDDVRGQVRDVGRDWVALLRADGARGGRTAGPAALDDDGQGTRYGGVDLVPLAAVTGVEGLTLASAPAVEPDGPPVLRLGLAVVLRSLARDRAYVRVRLVGGRTVGGTVDRVGVDHLDVAVHPQDEARRPGAVSTVRTVPFPAVVLVAAD